MASDDLDLDDPDKPGYETYTDNELDNGYLKHNHQEVDEGYLKPTDQKLDDEYLKPSDHKSKSGGRGHKSKRGGQTSKSSGHGNKSKRGGQKSKSSHFSNGPEEVDGYLRPGPIVDMVNTSPLYHTPSLLKQGTGWIHDDTSLTV